jgi:hypothetical protein
VGIGADTKWAEAQIDALKKKILSTLGDIPITANIDKAAEKLAKLQLNILALRNSAENITADINDDKALAKLAGLKAAIDRLEKSSLKTNVTDNGALNSLESKVRNALISYEALARGVENAKGALNDSDGAVSKAATALDGVRSKVDNTTRSVNGNAGSWVRLSGIVTNLANIHIPLFSTATHEADALAGSIGGPLLTALLSLQPSFMRTASGFHMLLEAGIEMAAVWIPATIAVAAFGLAAVPIAKNIYSQIKNMNTVVQGTGEQFQYLGKSASNLTAQIKPEVYQAFGIALVGLQTTSGTLGTGLKSVGTVIDHLAASIVTWLQGSGGQGLNKFLQTGAADASKLFQAFAAVGSIIHTLLQSTPGIATQLLNVGTAMLQGAAAALKLAEPLLKVFLAFHGYEFYIGLAATAFGILAIKAQALFTVFQKASEVEAGTTAIRGMTEASQAANGKVGGLAAGIGGLWGALKNTGTSVKAAEGGFSKFGAVLGIAAKEGGGLALTGEGLVGLVGGPWVIAAAAAAGAGYLIYRMLKDNVSEAARMEQTWQILINNSKTFAQAQTLTVQALRAESNQLLSTAAAFNKIPKNANGSVYSLSDISQAAQYARNIGDASKAIGDFGNEAATQQVRINALSKAFGGVDKAQQLMTLAGVKAGDLLSTNGKTARTAANQLIGTAEAYGLMGQQAGVAGQHLNALTLAQSAQVKAVQQLTSAESQFVSSITGADTNLQSFEGGMRTLNNTLTQGTTSNVTYTNKAGVLQQKLVAVKAGLSGTTDAALANRQAFASNVNAGEQLYNNLQTLSAESGNTKSSVNALAAAGHALVAQLLPMAKGSKSAQTEVFALAQTAGYTGNNSFAAMSKWAGKAKGAVDNLNGASVTLQGNAASLNQDVKNLNNSMQTWSDNALLNAITNTTHLQGKIQDMTRALLNNGKQINGQTLPSIENLYKGYKDAGMGASGAKTQVDNMLRSLGLSNTQIGIVNKSLDAYNAKLNAIPKQVYTKLDEQVSGSGGLKVTASGQIGGLGPGGGNFATFAMTGLASGGVVHGGIHGRDSVPTLLAPGELVIPSQHAPKFHDAAKRAGIPMQGMASGGIVGTGSVAASAINGLTAAAGQVTPFTQKAASEFATAAGTAFVKDMVNNVKNMYAGAGGVAGHVGSYAQDILMVLKMLNLSPGLLGVVEKQMQTESGGNPTIVNKSDINWQHGTPSVGLMQVIGPTFAANAGPYRNVGPFEYGVSVNPMANIFAGLNYARSRYGPGLSGLGQGHGYAGGGVLGEKVLGFGVNSGTPVSFGSGESVLPAGQAAAYAAGSSGDVQQLIPILQQQNRLLAEGNKIAAGQANQTGRVINSAAARSIRHGMSGIGG